MSLKPNSLKTRAIALGLFTATLIWLVASSITRVHKPVPVLTPPDGRYSEFKSTSAADMKALIARRRAAQQTSAQAEAAKYYLEGLRELQAGNKSGAERLWKEAAVLDPENIEIRKGLLSLEDK